MTHYYYRADPTVALSQRQGLDGYRIDVKTGNAYLVGAGCRIGIKEYVLSGAILPPEELPVIPTESLVKTVANTVMRQVAEIVTASAPDMNRVLRYVDKAEPAISGQRGHSRFYWLACRLLRVFPWLSREQLSAAMLRFNERCLPPFDIGAVEHKIDEALKQRGSDAL